MPQLQEQPGPLPGGGGGPQALPTGVDLLGWPPLAPAAFLHLGAALPPPYPPSLHAGLGALPPGWQALVGSGAAPPAAPPPLARLAPPLPLPESVRLNWPPQQAPPQQLQLLQQAAAPQLQLLQQAAPQQQVEEVDALMFLTANGAPPDL